MIHLYLDLFYEVHNTINHTIKTKKEKNSLHLIFLLILLDIFAKEIPKVLQQFPLFHYPA